MGVDTNAVGLGLLDFNALFKDDSFIVFEHTKYRDYVLIILPPLKILLAVKEKLYGRGNDVHGVIRSVL